MSQFASKSISLERELAQAAERLRSRTVEIRGPSSGRGSGVIWSSDGVVVTNAHVATAPRHTVELADGRIFTGAVTRRNPRVDLAAVQIDALNLPAAETRHAESLRPGELLLAVGNPFGATGAFSVGVVSASPKASDTIIRADIRLAPGNSGGPLADAQGRVVGINSMVVAGIGVAVTSTAVERFLGENGRKAIGITAQVVPMRHEGVAAAGMMVVELEPGSAAHLSGVLVGDLIVGVRGKTLRTSGELYRAIQDAHEELSLDVLREGRLLRCEILLVRKKASEVA